MVSSIRKPARPSDGSPSGIRFNGTPVDCRHPYIFRARPMTSPVMNVCLPLVAASGAFPGAFNPYPIDVKIEDPQKLRQPVGFGNSRFLLADGGIADNY